MAPAKRPPSILQKLCRLTCLLSVLSLLVPNVLIYVITTVDFLLPNWSAWDSSFVIQYHEFLLSHRQDIAETAVPEIEAANLMQGDIVRLTNDFSTPFVIRNALNDPTLELWKSKDWWKENYGDEQVICGGVVRRDAKDPFCTMNDFVTSVENGNPFYVSGGFNIFKKHEALTDALRNDLLSTMVEANLTLITPEMYMGTPGMGSDLHADMGCNLLRQITGRKKWWFIHPSETAFILPSINVNGFSSHTKTAIGYTVGSNIRPQSAWLPKLKRMTTIIGPGDVLLAPSWYWHAVLNMHDEDESADDMQLVIGIPTRFGGLQCLKASLKNNPVFTIIAAAHILYEHGSIKTFTERGMDKDVAENRANKEIFRN